MGHQPPTWTRSGSADRLDGAFDVCIIGGGVTGAGAALDLSSRGLSVALVEQADFAQGTSSRSTKLFHGGIRYLPQMHFGLISEGLREQKVLARIADFLFDPTEFVIPIYEDRGLAGAPSWAARGSKAKLALRAGLTLYDLLGGVGRPGARHRYVPTDRMTAILPRLRRQGLMGGFSYWDAQTDDSRLVIAVVKTAVRRFGAVAVPGVRAERITSLDPGFEILVHDRETGERRPIAARAVLAATGAFTPPGAGIDRPRRALLRSKGSHLLVDPAQLDLGGRAVVLPETDDGRVLYVIPWHGLAMIGTTDTPYDGDPAHPLVSDQDIEYLLRHMARCFDAPDLEPISTFAGLRALAAEPRRPTSRVSREHVVTEPVPGYVQVAGGKLTTYRKIAAEASDAVAASLSVSRRSNTAAIPLVGSGGHRISLRRRLLDLGIPGKAVEPMIGRYGTEVETIARMVESDPGLADPLSDGRTVLAEAAYAASYEAAAHTADVTLRRTHLAWSTPDHARADVHRIATVMAEREGWSDEQVRRQPGEYEADLKAEGL